MGTCRVLGWLLALSGILSADSIVQCNRVTVNGNSCFDTGPLGDFAQVNVNNTVTVVGNTVTFTTAEMIHIQTAAIGLGGNTFDSGSLEFTEAYTLLPSLTGPGFITFEGGKFLNAYDEGFSIIYGSDGFTCRSCGPHYLPTTLADNMQLSISGALAVNSSRNPQDSLDVGTGTIKVMYFDANLNPVNVALVSTPEPKNMLLVGLLLVGFVFRRKVLRAGQPAGDENWGDERARKGSPALTGYWQASNGNIFG